MGETRIAVMSKMPHELVTAIDREIELWYPAFAGRSAMVAMLSNVGISVFDAGIVSRNPQSVQGLLRKTSQYSITSIDAQALMGQFVANICKPGPMRAESKEASRRRA